MKGKIINFNQEKSFGFILGENGQNYFFHTSDVNLPFDVSKNKMLTFKASSNQKGLCAKNIVLEKGKQAKQNNNVNKTQKKHTQPQPKKKVFVQIGSIAVNLNDVKSAQVQGDAYNAKLLIKTYSSGILVGYYSANDAYDDLRDLLVQL